MKRLLFLVFATPALAAGAFDSDWSAGAKSRARLIADAQGPALEIALAPGAVTYWRDPGEAGVPPTFDFSKSENLARADVDFPAPLRIPEPDGSQAFGYRDHVTLPIRVTPADPAKPVRLAAHVEYGVCEKICLPARADVGLGLGRAGASPFGDALSRARAEVPVKLAPAALGLTVSPTGAKAWRLCLAEAPADLFVEAPEGYWIEPKREADGRCFALTLRQTPDGAKPPIAVRLTVERAGGAAETEASLGG